MTTTSNPNVLIKANGELNAWAWIEFEMKQRGGSVADIQREFQAAVVNMSEPPLTTKSGKPNPIWISWYKLRRQTRRSAALVLCKKLISGEVTDFDRKPILVR